jgi:regulator of protease activity HflC (stomatin/prohibitin superfamily)
MAESTATEAPPPTAAPANSSALPGAAVVAGTFDYVQLTQTTVPLRDAQLAFGTPDAAGRLPIILLPTAPFRINSTAVLIGAVSLIAGVILDVTVGARAVALAVGVVLLAIGIVPAFFVRIPEGSNAILLQRGRFLKTLGPGNQRLMPWIAISHLVTSREIPFDIPAAAVANSEGVRVAVDLLVTIRIVEPEKFVFAISAPDFDQVCQASGQDAIRRLIRGTSTDDVLDLSDPATDALKADIGQQLGQYGVRIEKAVLTAVRLPDDVMRSLESRRLATTQRAEETEIQALRSQRESSSQALDEQRAAARRRVIEIEAENETFRLAQLEKRLEDYPAASRWDFDGQRLEVARSLATNPRAIVQMNGADVATSVLMDEGTEAPDNGLQIPARVAPQRAAARHPRP